MDQKEQLLDLFKKNGNKLSLGEILKTPIGYEWRARATELRRSGYIIALERGKKASDNTYRLYEPEQSGQLKFA